MGWTSYHATHYKNGKVDRKAECDAYFLEGLNRGHYEVVKSVMHGAIYYAAVKHLVKYVGRDGDGKSIYEPLPKEDQITFAAVFVTSVDNNDYYNFSYKDMEESMGPCYYDCPISILNMLSPTDSEFANNWRETCRQKAKGANKLLRNLPIGARIKVTMPFDTRLYKKGDRIELQKYKLAYGNAFWRTANYVKFTQRLMKILEESGAVELINEVNE